MSEMRHVIILGPKNHVHRQKLKRLHNKTNAMHCPFKEGLGVMNTFEAQLQVKKGAKPRFCKARPIPFALKEAIDRELDRLESEEF